MREVLRKSSTVVGHVSYRSGDFSNNLLASNIAIEILGKRVVLSLDLSPSQPRGSEHSNSYLDAEDLNRNFETLEFLQLHRERWLEDGLRRAGEKAEEPAALELAFTFKDGTTRTMPVRLKTDEHNFWLHRKLDGKSAPDGES